MKASRIAAKVAARLLLFLILLALVPTFTNPAINTQLKGIYITASNKWVFAYPVLLILGFITLLILCTVKKYSKSDMNWLLVLNTLILILYGSMVFIRISHLIK